MQPKRQMQMKIAAAFVALCPSLALAQVMALWCYYVITPALGNIESKPCVGGCNAYLVCPGDEQCASTFSGGAGMCKLVPTTTTCVIFTGGVALRGCCSGGSPHGPGGTGTHNVAWTSGDCDGLFW